MKILRYEPQLPLEDIDISKYNVRKTDPEIDIDELANSIKEIGVEQPVVVFEEKGRYELIVGQRRYLACKRLKEKYIPALVVQLKDKTEASIASFSENIHRLPLNYRDKMKVAYELRSKLASIDSVAKRLGVTAQTVRNYLGYAAVPEAIKEMVDKGELSRSTAVYIMRNIPDEQKATRIAKKVKETPSSEKRWAIVEVAKANPDITDKEITKIAEQIKYKRVTVNLTTKVATALSEACGEYRSKPEEITTEALVEWLTNKGFYK